MQPTTSTRPVMDVARPIQTSQRPQVRPGSARPGPAARPMPAALPLAQDPAATQPTSTPDPAVKSAEAQPLAEEIQNTSAASQSRPATPAPVGVITIAVFFMIALSGLAIMVYVST